MFYSEPISAAAGGADCSLYFPVSNSFDDGSDDVPVAAMVPSPATLTVFKSGTGGIFVHSPKNGAYPCISGAAATGTAARGGAVFFAGYPTFVTARGVMRLSGSSNSYERRAESLSADRPDIAELLSSYADECSLCVFGDRLVLCGRGEILSLIHILVLPDWSSASADSFIIMSSEANRALGGNMFFNRIPLTVMSWEDYHTGNHMWNGRCRFGVGFGSYKHIMRFDYCAKGATVSTATAQMCIRDSN